MAPDPMCCSHASRRPEYRSQCTSRCCRTRRRPEGPPPSMRVAQLCTFPDASLDFPCGALRRLIPDGSIGPIVPQLIVGDRGHHSMTPMTVNHSRGPSSRRVSDRLVLRTSSPRRAHVSPSVPRRSLAGPARIGPPGPTATRPRRLHEKSWGGQSLPDQQDTWGGQFPADQRLTTCPRCAHTCYRSTWPRWAHGCYSTLCSRSILWAEQ